MNDLYRYESVVWISPFRIEDEHLFTTLGDFTFYYLDGRVVVIFYSLEIRFPKFFENLISIIALSGNLFRSCEMNQYRLHHNGIVHIHFHSSVIIEFELELHRN